MTDNINIHKAIDTDSSESPAPSKSKRLNYEHIKELCQQAQSIREQLHRTQEKEVQEQLDRFIEEIGELEKSTSKYLDSDEVISDLEWIIEYYDKKEWNNVTRWLSNIDSSIREMWSCYITKIIANKNLDQNKPK